MSVAYVVEQNTQISKEGERLLVKKGKELLHTLHLFKLEQLVLFGNVQLTPSAITALLQEGIDTVFMTRYGRYKGRLQPPYSKNITLRMAQFQRFISDEFTLRTARSIVAGKLSNMRAVLLRLMRNREGLRLEDSILRLKRLAEQARNSKDMDSVRGYEGRGSVIYFDGLARGFLVDGVVFRKRVRRPPTDPVNALLSLGYTLLFNTVNSMVNMIGLDPYLGSLHAVEYGRPSLTLDLMEEWRPVIVDTLVLSVFNLRAITTKDFLSGGSRTQDEDEEQELEDAGATEFENDKVSGDDMRQAGATLPVRLTEDGLRKFITQFERKMNQKVLFHLTSQQFSYRDCIREQVRHFARYVRGEEEEYQPVPVR